MIEDDRREQDGIIPRIQQATCKNDMLPTNRAHNTNFKTGHDASWVSIDLLYLTASKGMLGLDCFTEEAWNLV